MAYFRKTAKGWRVEVVRKGVRTSATFPHKATAQAWATQQENDILSGKASKWPRKTLLNALDRYQEEVSPNKRGQRSEGLRFAAIARDFPELCSKVISEIKTPDLAAWRDSRLGRVSKGAVQRDINLLRHVWTVASDEWHWCDVSAWKGLKTPGDNPGRTQRIPWQKVRRIVRWLGYQTGKPPATKYQEVAHAFLIALSSAMRAGEVMGLSRNNVNLRTSVVTLETHKTVESAGTRYVPLTPRAARKLATLHQRSGPLWTITSASLDALFRKARDSCGVTDIHFHDSRAEALTLLARRVDILTLQKISGHRDIRQLQVYYRETAEQVAARLSGMPSRPPAPSAASASKARSPASGSPDE